jgi:hypothetical protein
MGAYNYWWLCMYAYVYVSISLNITVEISKEHRTNSLVVILVCY